MLERLLQLHFSAKIENCSSSPPFRRHPRILCVWRTEVLSSKTQCWRLLCAVSTVTLRGPTILPLPGRRCLLRRNTVIRNTQISAITIVIFHRHNFSELSSTVRWDVQNKRESSRREPNYFDFVHWIYLFPKPVIEKWQSYNLTQHPYQALMGQSKQEWKETTMDNQMFEVVIYERVFLSFSILINSVFPSLQI